jgi:hypothetical protein
MTGRLDWRKARLDGKPKMSICDEQDHLDKGFTARWLANAEKKAAERERAQARRKRKHAVRR